MVKYYEILISIEYKDFIIQEHRRIGLKTPYNLDGDLDREAFEVSLKENFYTKAQYVKILDHREAALQEWTSLNFNQ